MKKRSGVIKFDLSDDKWFNDPDTFWKEFRHTGEILIPDDLEKWLIGQERMKEEFFLNLEEWVRKMKDIQELRRQGKADDKDAMRRFLKERPGPYLLYIGQPGTGKSLLIKIANRKMKELYKKHGIELQDVLLISNPINKQRPKVRYCDAGMGRRVKQYAEYRASLTGLKQAVIRGFLGFLMLMGALMIATGFFIMFYFMRIDPAYGWFSAIWAQWLMIGLLMVVFPMMAMGFGQAGMGFAKKVNEQESVPALIIDNSGDPDLFVDMTQGNAGKMFGSIQHDPWQSGGLGTPTHHRMQAGSIHFADGKILYADEIKNFLRNDSIVIETLTVMEDGAYPIRARQWAGSDGNASLAGETDTPIDATFFLIAAGNYDALPALNAFPALRDRFYYGNIVRSEDEIDATPENEIKIAQFIADETYRFHFPPVCSAGVRVIIGHMRRRASTAKKMRLQMRAYIQDIKKSAQIVWKYPDRKIDCQCGLSVINIIHSQDIRISIDDYAKPIEMQILDHEIDKGRPFKIIEIGGAKSGSVNGLVVAGSGEYITGDVTRVSAWLMPVDDPENADFVVTGAPTEDKDTWMQNSIRTVRTTIYRIYGIDLAKEYYVHVSFVQSDAKALDGPSAGITMTLAVMSCLGDPRKYDLVPVPMRQDTAVTGTVENLGDDGDVRVGPIGGVFEKTYGASRWGIKRVVIPEENYDNTYFDKLNGRDVEVLPAKTVMQYFDLVRAE